MTPFTSAVSRPSAQYCLSPLRLPISPSGQDSVIQKRWHNTIRRCGGTPKRRLTAQPARWLKRIERHHKPLSLPSGLVISGCLYFPNPVIWSLQSHTKQTSYTSKKKSSSRWMRIIRKKYSRLAGSGGRLNRNSPANDTSAPTMTPVSIHCASQA